MSDFDFELNNKSLFLLFLVVSGNYIGELLGCKTQKLLSENIYMKHIVLLCLIYFTINLVGEKKKHPVNILKNTLILWLFYLVLTKMNLQFTIIVLCLLFSLYIWDEYQDYLDESKEDYNKERYESIQLYLQYSIIGFMLVGFVLYYIKQRKEHSKDFSNIKFLLGRSTCDFKK